ncbi:MAG: hypothetical protein VB092_08965 [Oscillospiraceae bacterium]|nr:hypothetical protein [Oscillospiraceae bacterium]
MGYTRIYQYQNSVIPFKHVYIKRDRFSGGNELNEDEKGICNEQKIINALKLDEALSRARRYIVDIILSNEFEYFCTFTFKPDKVDRFDLNACFKMLSQYFHNYKTKFASDFKFLIVPEFHKDGAVHFHGCCSGFAAGDLIIPDKVLKRVGDEVQLVPNTKGYLRWLRYDKNMGIFNCSPIKNNNAAAFYIVKYITKNMKQIPKGTHLYSCSRGLNRPELVVDEDYLSLMAPVCYESDFVKIGYTRYDDYFLLDEYELMPEWMKQCERAEQLGNVIEMKDEIVCFDYEQLSMVQ